ncbi:MAG: MBL fold metallo-hydrolase [Propionicimonas sp.]|nr:MBL fold metallo-hydrolase [Propionicimonas sp.]
MDEPRLSPFEAVTDGVYVAVAEPASVNVGLVVGTESALVVDTGSSPHQGEQIRQAAEQVAGVPLGAVAVTHWHWDHFFGLAAFADLPSYGHETLAERLGSPDLLAEAAGQGVDATELRAPNRPFSLARVIDLGGRRVELVHFGRGHTEGDVVAIVPDANTIVAGDLLEQSGPPSFGPDCHLKDWPSAVDGILGLVDEDTVLIPGHGSPVDRFYGFEQRARISAVYGQVEYLVSRGVKLDAAYQAGEWPFEAEVIRPLLPLAYQQLAAEGKVPRTHLPML